MVGVRFGRGEGEACRGGGSILLALLILEHEPSGKYRTRALSGNILCHKPWNVNPRRLTTSTAATNTSSSSPSAPTPR